MLENLAYCLNATAPIFLLMLLVLVFRRLGFFSQAFADKLEQASIAVIEGGTMTKDLAGLWEGDTPAVTVTSRDFLLAIRDELERRL